MSTNELFGSEVFFHNGKIVTQTDVQEWSILNSYENLQPERFASLTGKAWDLTYATRFFVE
jgi:hypothetical protein